MQPPHWSNAITYQPSYYFLITSTIRELLLSNSLWAYWLYEVNSTQMTEVRTRWNENQVHFKAYTMPWECKKTSSSSTWGLAWREFKRIAGYRESRLDKSYSLIEKHLSMQVALVLNWIFRDRFYFAKNCNENASSAVIVDATWLVFKRLKMGSY